VKWVNKCKVGFGAGFVAGVRSPRFRLIGGWTACLVRHGDHRHPLGHGWLVGR